MRTPQRPGRLGEASPLVVVLLVQNCGHYHSSHGFVRVYCGSRHRDVRGLWWPPFLPQRFIRATYACGVSPNRPGVSLDLMAHAHNRAQPASRRRRTCRSCGAACCRPTHYTRQPGLQALHCCPPRAQQVRWTGIAKRPARRRHDRTIKLIERIAWEHARMVAGRVPHQAIRALAVVPLRVVVHDGVAGS